MMKKIILLVFLSVLGIGYGKQGFGPGQQEWNYTEVRPKTYMFWWLYFSTVELSSPYDAPLIIWLEGGPGASSTAHGNFEKIGPLNQYLLFRNSTWVKYYNVLFIDYPIGSGYSYTLSGSYSKTNEEIASDLLLCIKNVFELFPRFQSVSSYIFGVSYGGKVAVELSALWYRKQLEGEMSSNLRGLAFGDAWISPIDTVMSWAPCLRHKGLIDLSGYDKIMQLAVNTSVAVNKKQWTTATFLTLYTQLMITNLTNNKIKFYNTLLKINKQDPNVVEFNPKNFTAKILTQDNVGTLSLAHLMNSISHTLKLSFPWGTQSVQVLPALWDDIMKPVVNKVEYLLNRTDLKVFVYTGELDLHESYKGALRTVHHLNWRGAPYWKSAPRLPMNNSKGEIEGYVQTYRKFKMFWLNEDGNKDLNGFPVGMADLVDELTTHAMVPDS